MSIHVLVGRCLIIPLVSTNVFHSIVLYEGQNINEYTLQINLFVSLQSAVIGKIWCHAPKM